MNSAGRGRFFADIERTGATHQHRHARRAWDGPEVASWRLVRPRADRGRVGAHEIRGRLALARRRNRHVDRADYPPGSFARTPEIVELARAVAAHDGLYASHMRNEGREIFPALDEVFRVAREAGLPAEVSHIKLSGPASWGQADAVIEPSNRQPFGTRPHTTTHHYREGIPLVLVNGVPVVEDGCGRRRAPPPTSAPQTRPLKTEKRALRRKPVMCSCGGRRRSVHPG